MFCDKCGADLGAEEKVAFCPNCGNPIGGQGMSAAESGPGAAGGEAYGQGAQEEETVILGAPESGGAETMPVWSGAVEDTVVYCPGCGAQNKKGDTFCGNCGAPLNQTEVAVGGGAYGPFTQPEKPKKKPPLGIIGGVVAVVAVVILAVVFLPKAFSGKKESQPLIYLKDNELTTTTGRKREPLRIGDDFYDNSSDGDLYAGSNSPLQYTRDGKYLFYKRNVTGGSYDVYYRKAGGKGDDSQRLDSGIIRYSVISRDKIVYIKDELDRKLYLASTEDKERLASDVESYAISKDDKYILWKETGDTEYKLYVQELSGKKDKQKIDNVSWVVDYSEDFSTLVYVKEDALYVCKDFGDPEKIASDVSQVYTYDIDGKLEMYYLKYEDGEDGGYTLYDLFDDDLLGADSAMQEPRIEDYQTKTYEDGFWGRREVVKTSDEYYDAMAEYDEKVYRDDYREALKEETMGLSRVSIYYYEMGADSGELVAEIDNVEDGIHSVSGADSAMLYYYNFDLENAEKLKLSTWLESGTGDLYEALLENIREGTEIQFVRGTESRPVTEIDLEETDDLSMVMNKKTGEIYVSVYLDSYEEDGTYNGREASLYAWDYKKDGGKYELLSDELSYLAATTDSGIYYFCEVNKDGDAADLYLNGTKVDSDVYPYSLNTDDEDRLLYLKDIDSDQQTGELYCFYKGKTQKVSGDCAINSYGVVEGNSIVYLSDYSFKRDNGDLMMYNGKDSSRIDTEVTCVFFGKTSENRGSVR